MFVVDQRHRCHAHLFGLGNRHLHRLRPGHDPQPSLGAQRRRRRSFAQHLHLRMGIGHTLPEVGHIALHLQHAVTNHSAQLGVDEQIGNELRIGGWYRYRGENLSDQPAQLLHRNAATISRWCIHISAPAQYRCNFAAAK